MSSTYYLSLQDFVAAEVNYNIHDRELLAIFEAFKCWCHYLEGTPEVVDVVTDHRNLAYLCKTKSLTCRQARWSEYLSQFNFAIRFRPGKLGTKPDALTGKENRGNRVGDGSKIHA